MTLEMDCPSRCAELERKIADLSALRSELTRVLGSCRHGTIADCKIIESLAPTRQTKGVAE